MYLRRYTPGAQPTRSHTAMMCLALAVVFSACMTVVDTTAAPPPDTYPYTFVDVGTLGGPLTYHTFPGTVLNNRGMLALFGSDIPALDPHRHNPDLCFNPSCHLDHAAIWHNGHLKDLGAFPGQTSSGLNGMSPNGVFAAGLSTDGSIDPGSGRPVFRGALFTGGKVVDLGTFGGPFSGALDVNNQGQVVGLAQNAVADPFDDEQALPYGHPGPYQDRAFLWQNGKLQDLGTLGGNHAQAQFINESGQIAGSSFTTTVASPTTGKPTLHPFLWERGTMRDLGSLGGTWGTSAALNNRGQVIGTMNLSGDQAQHAFLWEQGNLTDLRTLGGENSEALWINASGSVVGRANLAGATTYDAFLWKNGKMMNLGRIPGEPCGRATGVNKHDQVVGLAGGGSCGTFGQGFLWDKGTLYNLNALVAPVAGWRVQVRAGFYINDHGVIYGVGVLANGDERAVMLLPKRYTTWLPSVWK